MGLNPLNQPVPAGRDTASYIEVGGPKANGTSIDDAASELAVRRRTAASAGARGESSFTVAVRMDA